MIRGKLRNLWTGRSAAPRSDAPGRTSTIIRGEIEERFGFFPPFFDPALGIPNALDTLWQQTRLAYFDNPLPALFKEKLIASLSRSCSVPYPILCHSCALRPLGMRASEILELLEREPRISVSHAAELETALRAAGPIERWPEPGAPLEGALLDASILLFLKPDASRPVAAQLRQVLGPLHYAQLAAFLAYVKTSLAWAEAHPDVSYEADYRVATNLQPLLSEEPRLAEFFRTYAERPWRDGASGSAVLAGTTAVARDGADSEERFRRVFDDAPIGMALVGLDLTLLRVNTELARLLGCETAELLGQSLLALASPSEADAALARQLFEEEGGRRTLELRLSAKGGESLAVAVTLTVIRQDDGLPLHAVAVVEEIGSRDDAESALREATARLATSTTKLERRTRDLARLGGVGELLEACVSAEEIHSVVAKFGRELFPEESGTLYLLDDARHVAAAVANWGSVSGSAEVFTSDECWALRRGRVHAVRDADAGLACGHLKMFPAGGYVCAPLEAAGEAIGVLHLRGDAGSPAEPVQDIAAAFAALVAFAVSNFRLREILRAQALRDPLTGVFSRRHLEDILERETQRARRHQRRLALVIADIDHFRRFNDTYGREAGDEILRTFGTYLQAHARSEDWACRFGGAEFAVVMPECSAEGARLWAERLREQVKRMEVRHWGRLLPAITLSLGVAANDDPTLNGRDLLRVTDEAVQRAKADGGDQASVSAIST